MNYIKRLAFIVAILLLIVFLVSLFLPSTIKVEQSILIKTKPELLFKQINNTENIAKWSVWENKKIEVKKSTENQTVEFNSDFGYNETKEILTIKEHEQEIELTWEVEPYFGFNPIAKIRGMFIDEVLIKNLKGELNSLKNYTENLPQINSSKVSKQFLSEKQWYLSIRDTINQMQMSNIHGKLYSEINGFMDNHNIISDLAPLVIYHYWSDTLVDIEAGIQIKDSIGITDDRVRLSYIAIGNYVTATHYGVYERIPETYFSINEWMRKNEAQVIGPPWEVYVTDPAVEPNPEKWETQINFPIQ
jgi:AraC family transcriptional regulator